MAYASPYPDGQGLSQIDGETLQTIYTREELWGEKFFLVTDNAQWLLDFGPGCPDRRGRVHCA